MRYFRYTGPDTLTRGDHGVRVRGGHTTEDDPRGIYVFDPDFGDRDFGSVEVGVGSGDWVEIPKAEYDKL